MTAMTEPLYTCQAVFLGTRTRCSRPATSSLRAEGAVATSATMRAYCDEHDAQALTAARWTHAVLDPVDKPCTACDLARACGGLEYQAHVCPCHHWNRHKLDEYGRCDDETCSCADMMSAEGAVTGSAAVFARRASYRQQQARAGRLTCCSCGRDLGAAGDPYRDPDCQCCSRPDLASELGEDSGPEPPTCPALVRFSQDSSQP
jgi:hypothetical protein